MLKRRHYIFYGRVQGVGFRITCFRIATKLGLTGWVRNLSDGRVEACVQGEESRIQSLVDELSHSHFIGIEHFDSEEIPVLYDEKSFGLKY